MSKYKHPIDPTNPSNQTYDVNAEYVVMCDDEAIFPHWVDGILDLWTAETVCEFIKEICPDKVVTMHVVTPVEEATPKPTISHNLRVL